MIALVSLLVIVAISLLVVRIGSMALTMTGLSKDLASFQAQSAFSGVGFTTSESEMVVSHPARRNIVRLLMLMGNAGITSAIATLVLTFYHGGGLDVGIRLAVVVVGLGLLWLAARSKLVDRLMTRVVRAALTRWTDLRIRDYAKLLEVAEGYSVLSVAVDPSDWLCDRSLGELKLNREGVLVLGVRRPDGTYYGVLSGDVQIHCGDTITCYGREELLKHLASRRRGPKGQAEHEAAVQETIRIEKKQTEPEQA